jgi:hypothetical protein
MTTPSKAAMDAGKLFLSCGHEADGCCSGVPVEYQESDGLAYAIFCHACAIIAAEQRGREAERAEIVAYLQSAAFSIRCAQVCHGSISDMCADAIEARQHKGQGND